MRQGRACTSAEVKASTLPINNPPLVQQDGVNKETAQNHRCVCLAGIAPLALKIAQSQTESFLNLESSNDF